MRKSKNQPKKSANIFHNGFLSRIKAFKLWQKIVGTIAIVALLVAGGGLVWRALRNPDNVAKFQININQPAAATFQDDAFADFIGSNAMPEPNNNRTIGTPGELIISYDQTSGPYVPAFRMDLSDKDIADGIRMEPAMAGKWARRGPNTIVFTPSVDWPADMRFSVRIKPTLINSDARVNTRRTKFTTSDIAATVNSFNTYQAAAPKAVTGVAIVSFNYPIDTKKFADRTIMRIDGKRIDFTVRFDRFHRTAIITTAPIEITDEPQILRLKINRIPAERDDAMTQKTTANITIEAADNIFKISDIETNVVDDTNGLPQQLLLINTTSQAAKNIKWDDYVALYLLPENRDDEDKDNPPHKWALDEITDAVLKKSTKLKLTPIDFETPAGVHQYAFSYDVSENKDRFLYVDITGGIPSAGGFKLKNGATDVLRVPYPERSVKIAGSGALLAMGGEKKLAISARGGAEAAYINLYKVKSDEINHLVSQTYNVFGDMEFKSWSFDAYDMSVVFKKKIGFADTSMKSVNYASVDLGDYLDRTHADKTGIFIVQTGPSQSQADYSDRRLILLTDLGILRKVNLDGTSAVFISSLTTGAPADDVEIYVLGRNGNSIWAGRTDNMGRADIPALPWDEYRNEKAPVAIVARRGNDISFIPYNNGAYEQRVEYSKFDIDGVYASNTGTLNAFLFTDRGIYRPGENAVIGGIVKSKSFKSVTGLPVKLEMRDARGRTVLEKMFSLSDEGMFDAEYHLPKTAPLGEYYINLYSLNAKNKIQDLLGSGNLWVSEFTPDNLKINASITGAAETGWADLENISANVSLRNMFGTPASDRLISARVILTPAQFKFAEYPEYNFTGNFIAGTGLASNAAAQTITRELEDVKTDSNGNAIISFDAIGQIPDDVTYKMTTIIQGHENGGHSVQTALHTQISGAKYLIGWHANADLKYIKRATDRNVNLIAVDHTAARTEASGLTLRLVKRENLTSLIKDGEGYYKYQTVARDKTITQQQISVGTKGMDITLDTATPGTYYLQVLDSGDRILANIEYFVAGNENTEMQTDTQAELQIKLDAAQYAPGDDITVAVTAPYAGYGLITIERDKVYAAKWFRAETTNSVQHIKVPAEFEGTGYVNVSFVRDINSRDIFTTPYTYAVAPFAADTARRTINIRLAAPATIKDHSLKIDYETNRDAKIMIFAVNEGILQVAKYQIPNPVAHFFKKAALQVETYQTLSLILPEYKILREFAKTGGGDYDGGIDESGATVNPFARKTDAPVAFYSGIINATASTPGSVTFDIPESFNGSLRVFAVAAGVSGIGAADTTVHVQSPIIVTVNAPVAVAPGDKFDVNAVVANLTGENTAKQITLAVQTTGPVTTAKQAPAEFALENGAEKLLVFNATAADEPGAAKIEVTATAAGLNKKTGVATMSVRPVTLFTTDVKTGQLDKKKTKLSVPAPDMYSKTADRTIYISYGADALVRPLAQYLKTYEWNCTEQLVSRATPYVLSDTSTYSDADEQISKTVNELKTRQNANGSFAMWPNSSDNSIDSESDAHTANITAYTVQFLTMARKRGFEVPANMLSRALDYLRTYAGTPIRNPDEANAHAFAIYIVTANEYVTTAYINQFEEWADKNMTDWQSNLAGAYIATAYRIMLQSDRAEQIMEKYVPNQNIKYSSEFDNTIANDAIYQYLNVKYFKQPAAAPSAEQIKYINGGEYTSQTAAALIMGLSGGITDKNVSDAVSVSINGKTIKSENEKGPYMAHIPANTPKIEVNCPECGTSTTLFWTITDQGFPKTARPESDGIEIARDYYDMDGNRINSAAIGDRITVKIHVRTTGDTSVIRNAVVADLLPGGLVVDSDSLKGEYNFAEIREDRVVIYPTLSRDEAVYEYTAQAAAAGTFAIPPITAQSMYNPGLHATGRGGTFTIDNETDD